MRFACVFAVLSRINLFIGMAMLAPMACALIYGEGCWVAIAEAMAVTIGICGLFSLIFRMPKEELTHREGMMIVSLGWLTASFFGSLPYIFGDLLGPVSFDNIVNCIFESVSGFTTTGASVLGTAVPIESVDRGLLLWRSTTQWMGGMGIIVLAIAIMPLLGVGGMQLFRSEAPGPTKEKLRPRIRETAATLWMVYLALTALETLLLMLGEMDLFEAVCHAFTTMSTGGFSTRDASVGAFNSSYIDYVVIFFMFISGANFALHYHALTGRLKSYWRSTEFKAFLLITASATLTIGAFLMADATYPGPMETLRGGAFQVVSIITTTGFATADFEVWPFAPQIILLLLMFVGGCAGSTSGSIKTARVVLLVRYAYREIFRLVHPHSFAAVKFDRMVVHKDVLESVCGFFILFVAAFSIGSLAMTGMGMDILTSISSVASALGNVGPGLGTVGPAENYHHLPSAGKMMLSALMILGRLEIYTVLILLVPEFWKK